MGWRLLSAEVPISIFNSSTAAILGFQPMRMRWDKNVSHYRQGSPFSCAESFYVESHNYLLLKRGSLLTIFHRSNHVKTLCMCVAKTYFI